MNSLSVPHVEPSTHQIAAELELDYDDAQQITTQLRLGIVEKPARYAKEAKLNVMKFTFSISFTGSLRSIKFKIQI